MLISKIVTGPTYNPTTGWLLRCGEVERVRGAVIGVGTSCLNRPQVAACSGNVVTVKMYTNSGTPSALSTVYTVTDFFVVFEGI